MNLIPTDRLPRALTATLTLIALSSAIHFLGAKDASARERELQTMLSDRTAALDKLAELKRQRQEVDLAASEPTSNQGRAQALANQLAGLHAQIAQLENSIQTGDRGLRALISDIRAGGNPEARHREQMLTLLRKDKEQTEAIHWLTLGYAEVKDPKTSQTRAVRILEARPPIAKILDPEAGEKSVYLKELTALNTPKFDPTKLDHWVWVKRSGGGSTPCKIVKDSLRGDQVEVEWFDQVQGKNTRLTKVLALADLKAETQRQALSHIESNKKLLNVLSKLQEALRERPSPALGLAEAAEGALDRPNVISKYQCDQIAFDNRNRMAADTDQQSSSLCWAHAAAGLLEEQLCLAEPKYCGQRVARSEVAGQTYAKQNIHALAQNEGGKGAEGLRYYLDPKGGGQKVCLDKYGTNPFDVGDERYLNTLKSLFREYQAKTGCGPGYAGGYGPRGGPGLDEAFFNKFFSDFTAIHEFLLLKDRTWSVQFDANRVLDGQSFLRLLQSSHSDNDFAQKVLLFYCQDVARKDFSRKGAPPLTVVEHYLSDPAYTPREDRGDPKAVAMEPYLAELRTAKRSGHSVYLSICYFSLIRDAGLAGRMAAELTNNTDKCGGHAVLANGARWNPDLNRCELHVKNSHGKDATLKSTWYDAQTVLSHSKGVSYYRFAGK